VSKYMSVSAVLNVRIVSRNIKYRGNIGVESHYGKAITTTHKSDCTHDVV
jgi:hypothetical protein